MKDAGTIATEYAMMRGEMLRIHDGETLLASAREILDGLADEPLTFVATSVEGTALAAVCAALHGEGSNWQRVTLVGRPHQEVLRRVVVVEPVDGGRGWRTAIRRSYPDAQIVVNLGASVVTPA